MNFIDFSFKFDIIYARKFSPKFYFYLTFRMCNITHQSNESTIQCFLLIFPCVFPVTWHFHLAAAGWLPCHFHFHKHASLTIDPINLQSLAPHSNPLVNITNLFPKCPNTNEMIHETLGKRFKNTKTIVVSYGYFYYYLLLLIHWYTIWFFMFPP